MNEWHNIISGSIGVDPNQADYLEPLLRDCGFADIQIKKIIIPVGEWPTDKGKHIYCLFIFTFYYLLK
jgi:hypothetical protein